jgi:hypothetical protein
MLALTAVGVMPEPPPETLLWPFFFSASVGQSPGSRTNGHKSPLWQPAASMLSLAAAPPAGAGVPLLADGAGAAVPIGAVVTVLVLATVGVMPDPPP